jgi:hypothetical protein
MFIRRFRLEGLSWVCAEIQAAWLWRQRSLQLGLLPRQRQCALWPPGAAGVLGLLPRRPLQPLQQLMIRRRPSSCRRRPPLQVPSRPATPPTRMLSVLLSVALVLLSVARLALAPVLAVLVVLRVVPDMGALMRRSS